MVYEEGAAWPQPGAPLSPCHVKAGLIAERLPVAFRSDEPWFAHPSIYKLIHLLLQYNFTSI